MDHWTNDEIKTWLRKKGESRSWLATQLRATKGTVDQWFSKGFPIWAAKNVQLLALTDQNTGGLQIAFTPEEWNLIQNAMRHAGHTDQNQFFRDAIKAHASLILAGQTSPRSRIPSKRAVVTAQPTGHEFMAAEPPAQYRARKNTESA